MYLLSTSTPYEIVPKHFWNWAHVLVKDFFVVVVLGIYFQMFRF